MRAFVKRKAAQKLHIGRSRSFGVFPHRVFLIKKISAQTANLRLRQNVLFFPHETFGTVDLRTKSLGFRHSVMFLSKSHFSKLRFRISQFGSLGGASAP
jgi:hypothetical protein